MRQRTVYKARLVPDSAPTELTTKVIRVEDLGVPVAAALGRWHALTDEELATLRVFLECEAAWRRDDSCR